MSDQRLIDANALYRDLNELATLRSGSPFTKGLIQAMHIVRDAPTVDAVPVVRCRECKHRGDPVECYMCFTEVKDISGGRMYKFTDLTHSDGFCHKGEKMDGGAEG